MVKDDFIEILDGFHKNGSFVKSLNATFLVLIAKRDGHMTQTLLLLS